MNRKNWLSLISAVVIVLAGMGAIPAWIGSLVSVAVQEYTAVASVEENQPVQIADVVRVVDGDTIEVILRGPDSVQEMIRLIGVDTPETKHPQLPVQFYGPEATAFVESLCSQSLVKLHYQGTGPRRGVYGRLLVYVELASGKILNEEIVREGFGYSYTKYPHELTAKYDALQLEARVLKRGLWGTVKFDDLPGWLRKSNPDILK